MRINCFIWEGRNSYPLRVTVSERALRNASKRFMEAHGVNHCEICDAKGFPLTYATLYQDNIVGVWYYDGLKKYGWTEETAGRGY